MKTIQIEDDLYQFIAGHTAEIGEPATSILRRMLHISEQHKSANAPATFVGSHELAGMLSEPMFRRSTTAVSRMLRIFQEAYEQRQTEFHKVLKIRGRDRIYFARSEKEILDSSTTTQPREIPGTGYWVMTNSPTHMKRQMVRDVLKSLGYSTAAVEAAASVIQ